VENIWLIRYPLFFAAAMLGWWYLRRTNRETPVRNATLFTATALAFLFIPGYFSTGADTASALSVAVAAAAAIVPCVVIILVLGTRKRD
jgi:peptidoglycan/LPS O-acetylase OafA/YrhL